MADTQWPRFQVFLQEEPDSPHQDVGSVHAPDLELAMQNARDVFVRRPSCVSLWVAPAAAIYSRTAQEIREHGLGDDRDQGEETTYLVFNKLRPAGTQTYVGSVSARSPVQALQKVLDQFSGARPAFAWWALPERVVSQSSPEDIESMFAPALDKPFRLSTDFHVVSAMRQIRSTDEKETANG